MRQQAEVHNTFQDLHNSSDDTKAKFSNCFIFIQSNSQFKNMLKRAYQGRTQDFLSAGANSVFVRFRTNIATRNSPAKSDTMLEKKHLVFPAGATAPSAPPLCTALHTSIESSIRHVNRQVQEIKGCSALQIQFYSPNSSCHPSSCLLAVLAIVFSKQFTYLFLVKQVKCSAIFLPTTS